MAGTRHRPAGFSPSEISVSAPSIRNQSPSRNRQWAHVPSTAMLWWLLISVPVVIWDTGYVLFRPHSMAGGKYYSIWSAYEFYGTVDHVYGWPAYNSGSGFPAAQATLNVLETFCYIFYLTVIWTHGQPVGSLEKGHGSPKKNVWWYVARKKTVGGRMGGISLLVLFTAIILTLSKTILYMLNEAYSGFEGVGHNDFRTLFLFWIIPSGAWIVFPAIGSYSLGKEIVDALDTATGVAHDSKSKAS